MAGLLAARVLSDHFEQVTLIERDRLTRDTEPRKGVPQGRHVHALLARGAVILGEYFPDLFPTLASDGAIAVRTEHVRWNQLGVWMAPVRSPVKNLFQSRPFLEQHVREQLAARDNVRIMDACEVSQLCVRNDRVTGVVLRHRRAARGGAVRRPRRGCRWTRFAGATMAHLAGVWKCAGNQRQN
jgi:2-polyprenyl-6-methoxyphenol hydroxylase-like FAD-dependent oxidoreductase